MKYSGTFDDLKTVIKAVGYNIESEKDDVQTPQIRTAEGAIINFYPTTRTLQFQGKDVEKKELEKRLIEYLGPKSTANAATAITSFAPEKPQSATPSNKKVFVVHGHDTTAREQLELSNVRLGTCM
jgi:predicted nucleotide-binding protein